MSATAPESLLDDLRVIVAQSERIKAALDTIDERGDVLLPPSEEEVFRAWQNICEALLQIKCRIVLSKIEANKISNRLIEQWAKNQPNQPEPLQ